MQIATERQEQRLLLLSAVGTLFLSIVGVLIGLWTGAKSIVFDGMYDVVDASMTLNAWLVARLIARGDDRRFQYGYWHIEPMLAFLNGTVLLFACVYAFVDGVGATLAGVRSASTLAWYTLPWAQS
ncbi:cation transporter [Scytonema sp. NUACC26]|uniref:cation transporter n=1 Tax=Scytonema sp. NUACC26 TaxID=3140176 RepID=UPI0038B29A32